jgi:hypothetical protein
MKLKYFLLIIPILFWTGCEEDENDIVGSEYIEDDGDGGGSEDNYDPANLYLYSSNLYKNGSAITGSIIIKNNGELTAHNSEAVVIINYTCYNNLQNWNNSDNSGTYNLNDIAPNNTKSISINHNSTCSSDGNGWLLETGIYPSVSLSWD